MSGPRCCRRNGEPGNDATIVVDPVTPVTCCLISVKRANRLPFVSYALPRVLPRCESPCVNAHREADSPFPGLARSETGIRPVNRS